MNLLLDTLVLVWAAAGDERLGEVGRTAIESPQNKVFLSAVSAWEIALKSREGRVQFPLEPARLPKELAARGFRELPITVSHALAVADLPFHHADPFDRLLIAQAQSEGLVLVTADRQMRRYAVRVLRT